MLNATQITHAPMPSDFWNILEFKHKTENKEVTTEHTTLVIWTPEFIDHICKAAL